MSNDRSTKSIWLTLPSLAPALLSAAFLSFSFHTLRLEWLVWVALVPLFVWLAHPSTTIRRAVIGLWFVGAFYHMYITTPLLSLSWWAWGTATQEALRAYFSYQRIFLLVVTLLIAVWAGVVMALVGLIMRRQLQRPLFALWWVPAVWVLLLEYTGHATVFGLSWGLLGNRLHDAIYLRQLASLTGIYGLSFLIVFVNTAISVVFIQLLATSKASGLRPTETAALTKTLRNRPISLILTIAVSVILAAWGYGFWVVQSNPGPNAHVKTLLIQGHINPLGRPYFTDEGLERATARLLDEARSKEAGLVVLPENVWIKALSLDGSSTKWERERLSTSEMHEILSPYVDPQDRILVFGTDAIQDGLMYNATVFWTRDGFAGLYAKRRLVPFSEYRPPLIGRFAPQNRLHGSGFAYSQGIGPQLIRTRDLVIGNFICQEVLFPALVREAVHAGAQLLVTTGNDRVFLSPLIAWEHANLAKLRAVENRRFILRAMKGGITAVIDPLGRELGLVPLDSEAILEGVVAPINAQTPYTRFGDWIVWLSGLIVVIGLIRRRPN